MWPSPPRGPRKSGGPVDSVEISPAGQELASQTIEVPSVRTWRGRWLLRRKAHSYAYHSCAYIYGAAGCYSQALACTLKSLAWYPFPYQRGEVMTTRERPKRFFVNLLRSLHLRPAGPKIGRLTTIDGGTATSRARRADQRRSHASGVTPTARSQRVAFSR